MRRRRRKMQAPAGPMNAQHRNSQPNLDERLLNCLIQQCIVNCSLRMQFKYISAFHLDEEEPEDQGHLLW
jgi:hypothetical protein